MISRKEAGAAESACGVPGSAGQAKVSPKERLLLAISGDRRGIKAASTSLSDVIAETSTHICTYAPLAPCRLGQPQTQVPQPG
jgi:formyltetrahydrofolate synthetase